MFSILHLLYLILNKIDNSIMAMTIAKAISNAYSTKIANKQTKKAFTKIKRKK